MMMPGLSSTLFVMPFIISNYLHMIVIVGFQTKSPVCEWEVGSLYTNKCFSDTSCMSNALILTVYPEVTSEFTG